MAWSLRAPPRLRTLVVASTLLCAFGLAWLVAPAPSLATPVTLPHGRSGLAWASGTSNASPSFEGWRGRRLDLRTEFMSIDNWRNMIRSTAWVANGRIAGTRTVLGMGMLPKTHRGRHQECARGAFDGYMRQVGAGLVGNGLSDAVIRLGWEANRMGGFPWAVTGDGSSYKACFRRWVAVLRATPGQHFLIDWNMAARGKMPYSVDRIYPGSDVVDIIGVQQYDTCPPVRTEAAWQAKMHSRNRDTNGPFGLATWLAYAKSKGKALSIPEWGIAGRRSLCRRPGFDNPLYVRVMHEFLRANAGSIAYESSTSTAMAATVRAAARIRSSRPPTIPTRPAPTARFGRPGLRLASVAPRRQLKHPVDLRQGRPGAPGAPPAAQRPPRDRDPGAVEEKAQEDHERAGQGSDRGAGEELVDMLERHGVDQELAGVGGHLDAEDPAIVAPQPAADRL